MSVRAYNEVERSRASWARRGKPVRVAVRRGELLVGGSYVAVAVALALTQGVGHPSAGTALLYCVALAVAFNVRFDVGVGYTVPTQAVFVPMLFALPLTTIPLLMPVALALGMAPRVVRGEIAPSWLMATIGNSWFVIGPVSVLLLAGGRAEDGWWPVLLAALASQLLFDFVNSAVRERLFGEMRVRELLAEYVPVYAVDFALSTLGLAIAYSADKVHSQLALLLVAPLFGILRFFSKERRARLQQLAELNDAYQGTAMLLGDVVEADDSYTGEHCRSVVRVALEVADKLELNAQRRRNVELGALLHDVGKIAVPKEIINKKGTLNEREWEIIKTHTIVGERMLEKIGGLMLEIGRIVRSSHERWDGTGYPDRLSGEEIPLESRIIATCDAFNAMTTTRSYRAAMELSRACEELERCAGTQFDPVVAEAVLSIVGPGDAAGPAPTAPVPIPDAELAETWRSTVGTAQPIAR